MPPLCNCQYSENGGAGDLGAYDSKSMRCYPVSTRINHAANHDEECSRPVEIAKSQDSPFA